MSKISFTKILIVLLLLCICFGCNPRELPFVRDIVTKSEDSTTEQTEKAIAKSPELQKLNSICNSFPRPEDFKFTWKGGLDDEVLALSIHYYSDINYEEAKSFFINSLVESGGKLINEDDSYPKSIEFKKANYKIIVQHGGMGSRSNYAIDCVKLD